MPFYDMNCRRTVTVEETVTVKVFARTEKEANRLAKVAATESGDWKVAGEVEYGNAQIDKPADAQEPTADADAQEPFVPHLVAAE